MMDKESLNILVVDDHSLILNGLVESLNQVGYSRIQKSQNCDLAMEIILNSPIENAIDVVFLDLSFEKKSSSDIKCGEDLLNAINGLKNPPKVIVLTSHSETNRIINVVKNQDPDAYILKHECNATELDLAISKVMSNETYYSFEVHQKILKRKLVDIHSDDTAIEILKQLSTQYKISNMVGLIVNKKGKKLSLRSIDNRLAELRSDFKAINNIDLVVKAKELGVID